MLSTACRFVVQSVSLLMLPGKAWTESVPVKVTLSRIALREVDAVAAEFQQRSCSAEI